MVIDSYHDKILNSLSTKFSQSGKFLDVGCGNGVDAEIFSKLFKLNVTGVDIYRDKEISNRTGIKFIKGSILRLPFHNNSFDYIFLHNDMHHIDEVNQDPKRITQGLQELKRVCRRKGKIIIVEANRYNPLFYPHMVIYKGHQHITQDMFNKLLLSVFPQASSKYFEAHVYPSFLKNFWPRYEIFMENHKFLRPLLAYNSPIITNDK